MQFIIKIENFTNIFGCDSIILQGGQAIPLVHKKEYSTAGGPKWTKMTNEEKQKQKALASTVDPETARDYVANDIKLYSDKGDYVEAAMYQVGETIRKIRDERKWTNAQFLEHLDTTYFPNAETISRLVKHEEKRFPSAAQLFDLRRVFGISLDALTDGGDPFVFEEMSDARLVEIMEEASRELGRRIRQR